MHDIVDPRYPTRITVACSNFDAVPRDKAATLTKLLGQIETAAGEGADLVVFPELALNSWGRCEGCAAGHRPCDAIQFARYDADQNVLLYTDFRHLACRYVLVARLDHLPFGRQVDPQLEAPHETVLLLRHF